MSCPDTSSSATYWQPPTWTSVPPPVRVVGSHRARRRTSPTTSRLWTSYPSSRGSSHWSHPSARVRSSVRDGLHLWPLSHWSYLFCLCPSPPEPDYPPFVGAAFPEDTSQLHDSSGAGGTGPWVVVEHVCTSPGPTLTSTHKLIAGRRSQLLPYRRSPQPNPLFWALLRKTIRNYSRSPSRKRYLYFLFCILSRTTVQPSTSFLPISSTPNPDPDPIIPTTTGPTETKDLWIVENRKE